MRVIELTGTFKRDYKRETRGRHREILESDFNVVVMALAHDQPLAERHRDHALSGEWNDRVRFKLMWSNLSNNLFMNRAKP